MSSLVKLITDKISSMFQRSKSWKKIEYFDPAWEERVKKMAEFIKPGESVLDLGCGEMTLKKLRPDILYYPVDYIQRNENTIICDFNKKQFPGSSADTCFVSGTLEYISDPDWFVNKICEHCKKAVISYCSTDHFPVIRERRLNHWVNHLSDDEVLNLFTAHQFKLSSRTETGTHNQIYVFERV